MSGLHGRGLGGGARRRPGPARGAGCSGPAHHRHGLRLALPARRSLRRGDPGAALPRPEPAGLRRHARVCHRWRLRPARLRALSAPADPARRAAGDRRRSPRPPLPHEHRHHRRGADAEGAAGEWFRAIAGGGRGVLRQWAATRGYLHFRRAVAGVYQDRRDQPDLPRGAQERARPGGAGLRRWAHAADGQPGRPGAGHARRPVRLGAPARPGARVVAAAGGEVAPAQRRPAAGRDLPARGSHVSGCLLLRGTERTPDAGHAADQAAGALWLRAAGVCRLGLLHRDLVAAGAGDGRGGG